MTDPFAQHIGEQIAGFIDRYLDWDERLNAAVAKKRAEIRARGAIPVTHYEDEQDNDTLLVRVVDVETGELLASTTAANYAEAYAAVDRLYTEVGGTDDDAETQRLSDYFFDEDRGDPFGGLAEWIEADGRIEKMRELRDQLRAKD